MTRISVLFLALVAGHVTAAADAYAPVPPWRTNSGEEGRLWSLAKTASEMACPLDDLATKRKRLDDFRAEVAKSPKRDTMQEYADSLKAWFDVQVAGPAPDLTWAQADALLRDAKAAVAKLPAGQSEELVKANIDVYAAAAGFSKRVQKALTAIRNSACGARGDAWNETAGKLADAERNTESLTNYFYRDAMNDFDKFKGGPPAAGAVPTTYSEHVDYVNKQLDYLAAAQAFQIKLDGLKRYAAADARIADLLKEASAKLAATITAVGGITTELAKVKMPPLPQDATRAKQLAALTKTMEHGAQLGVVVSAKGFSTEKWTEEVEVKREGDKIWLKKVKFVRDHFTIYYAWKPEPPTLPDLPGMKAGDVCELWMQNFSRYTQGKPEKKSWYPSDAGRIGFLPCANATATSSLKEKKK